MALNIGATAIDKLMVGSAAVSKLMLGDQLVWPPPWSPADLPDLLGWFDGNDDSTFTTAGIGQPVSEWRSKVGNAKLTQPLAGSQMTRTAKGVEFTGTDKSNAPPHCMIANNMKLSKSEYSVGVAAANINKDSTGQAIRSSICINHNLSFGYGDCIQYGANGQGNSRWTNPNNFTWGVTGPEHVYVNSASITTRKYELYTAAALPLTKNQQAVLAGTCRNEGDVTLVAINVFAFTGTSPQGGGFGGEYRQLVFTRKALSGDNALKLQAFVAHAADLATELGATHPYKAAPP